MPLGRVGSGEWCDLVFSFVLARRAWEILFLFWKWIRIQHVLRGLGPRRCSEMRLIVIKLLPLEKCWGGCRRLKVLFAIRRWYWRLVIRAAAARVLGWGATRSFSPSSSSLVAATTVMLTRGDPVVCHLGKVVVFGYRRQYRYWRGCDRAEKGYKSEGSEWF